MAREPFKLPTKGASAPTSAPEPSNEVPRWELTEDAFIAPHLVRRGSIISSRNYPPGIHTLPLNDAARAKLEAWYAAEHVVPAHKDDQGHTIPSHVVYPHEQYRPFAGGSAPETIDFELLEGPPPDMKGEMDLAQAQFARPDPTASQAPGPLRVSGANSRWYSDMSTEALAGSTAEHPVPSGAESDDGVLIEASAPVPPPAQRVSERS